MNRVHPLEQRHGDQRLDVEIRADRFAARRRADVRLLRGPAGGLVAEVRLPADLVSRPGLELPRPDGPPLNRVDRMRARAGGVSVLADTSVDLSNVGIPRPGGTEAQ